MCLPGSGSESGSRLAAEVAQGRLDLRVPAFGEQRFFFEAELEDFYRENLDTSMAEDYE